MIQNKIEIASGVYLTGKIDDRDVPFHRLVLSKGTTYNSYLIEAEKPAVIDTVDISFGREFVEALSAHIDLSALAYIVINHVEPDHSGGLPALAAKAKNAVIVCTRYAADELKQMYNLHKREFLIVQDGARLELGAGKTLRFLETPWLHTEETMVTYLEEEGILFPCDIFSTHLANTDYFDDAADDITEDFSTYYRLIMHPHRRHVREMLEKIRGLEIRLIAPSHGYLLRSNPQRYIELYDSLSRETLEPRKAAVLVASMTGNTRKLGRRLKEYLEKDSIETELLDMDRTGDAEILAAVESADAVLVGTSTRYADAVGRAEEVAKMLASADLSGRVAGAFGSYGWSGEGIELMQELLSQTNMHLLTSTEIIRTRGVTDVQFPLRIRFLPEEETTRIIARTANFLSGILRDAE